MYGQLGFELSDPPTSRRQLSPLRGRKPGFGPLVHALLLSPAIHRLLADTEVDRDVTHASASGDQITDSLPKLRRIAPSAHAVLLLGQQHGSPVIRLHKTQDSPESPGFPGRFTTEQFTSDCWIASALLKKKLNYSATRFNQMLGDHGSVETARRLINSGAPSQGFEVLWEHHRLDLSVEAIAILPDYAELFTSEELASARQRLRDHHFDVEAYLTCAQTQRPPWETPPR